VRPDPDTLDLIEVATVEKDGTRNSVFIPSDAANIVADFIKKTALDIKDQIASKEEENGVRYRCPICNSIYPCDTYHCEGQTCGSPGVTGRGYCEGKLVKFLDK